MKPHSKYKAGPHSRLTQNRCLLSPGPGFFPLCPSLWCFASLEHLLSPWPFSHPFSLFSPGMLFVQCQDNYRTATQAVDDAESQRAIRLFSVFSSHQGTSQSPGDVTWEPVVWKYRCGFHRLCWLVLSTWPKLRDLRGGGHKCGNDSIMLSCSQACGLLSWSMIDMGVSVSRVVVPALDRWSPVYEKTGWVSFRKHSL